MASEGRRFAFGSYVVGAAFAPHGRVLALALGDGNLQLIDAGDARRAIPAHSGTVLAVAGARNGFVSGGDDGAVIFCGEDGVQRHLHHAPGKWIDAVASDTRRDAIAATCGREVLTFALDGQLQARLGPCVSTIAALAFSPDGSRVAAAHYGGASVWTLAQPEKKPRRFLWKGSHLGICYSPTGKYLATATQENAIHVWRVADHHDMQMSGYSAKVKSMAWSADGAWLLASGAETFTCWPFTGRGPEGRPPVEIGWSDGALVTQVAAHPTAGFAIAGFENGAVLLADLATRRAASLAPARDCAVSALSWSPDGCHVAVGFADGQASLLAVAS